MNVKNKTEIQPNFENGIEFWLTGGASVSGQITDVVVG